MARRAERVARLALAVLLACGAVAPALRAQEGAEPPQVVHAYDLENAGKYREAAQLFRASLAITPTPGALLGLERVYAELRISDSLLPVLDTLITKRPTDALYRDVQLRTLQLLRRDDALRAAFESWVRAVPRDPAPYREYARALLALGQPVMADSVVQRSRRALGSGRELAFETAQLRAAQGQWVASASAWRVALDDAPLLATAAGYAMGRAPAPHRDSIRVILREGLGLGARSALAELELAWGRPQEAWDALRALPADTASATVWTEFGERALAEGRGGIARAALAAALAVRRTPELALHAATAALASGAAAEAIAMLPLTDVEADPARLARDYLPLHVAALSALGRPAAADSLVRRYDRMLAPGQRERLSREVARAWVRAGDLARARAALGTGPEADSSDTAGWLALYEGRLPEARALLRQARDQDEELAFALGILARTRGGDGTALGGGFLALARRDTATAVSKFIEAAAALPEAAPALLLASARLRAAHGDAAGAVALWSRIVGTGADAPEAAEAELEWARVLRRRGDAAGAIAHLEHLILSAPGSALLPQARRELDLARAMVPGRQ